MNTDSKTDFPLDIQKALEPKIRDYHHRLSFICGAVETWELLAPEIASLKAERDAYRKALEDLRKVIEHSTIHYSYLRRLAANAFDSLPATEIVTLMTDSHRRTALICKTETKNSKNQY